MIIVRFDKNTLLPISFYDSPLPQFYLPNNEFVECSYSGSIPINPDIESFYIQEGLVDYDYDVALSLAKSRSIDSIRESARILLSDSDVRVKTTLEHLTIDRSDEEAIEKHYTVLSQRKRVRDSSNAAQEMILLCTSPAEAWGIAGNFDPRSSPITPLAPEITKNAFQQRLELTVQEKRDPVFQSMTSDLLALGYVDLRQADSTLNFLAQIGKLSAERVSNILSAPIQWKERPIHGV